MDDRGIFRVMKRKWMVGYTKHNVYTLSDIHSDVSTNTTWLLLDIDAAIQGDISSSVIIFVEVVEVMTALTSSNIVTVVTDQRMVVEIWMENGNHIYRSFSRT